MVSCGWARTLIAHERSSLLSSGCKGRPMSILEGEEAILQFEIGMSVCVCVCGCAERKMESH